MRPIKQTILMMRASQNSRIRYLGSTTRYCFIRIFIRVKGTYRKIIALTGIAIFIGYPLYDFNKIKKLKNAAEFNNWNTAMDSSISIYLSILT